MIEAHENIIVWKILVSQLLHKEDYYFSLLSEAEQKKSQAFVTKELTSKYVISQGVLRSILADYLGIDAKQVTYTLGPHKKPYLAQNPQQLYFNMSHSHDVVLVGISFGNEIGVDVEKCDPKIAAKHLEQSVLSARELQLYDTTPEHNKAEAFTCAWTHKEALLKLAGIGLYKDMKEVEVPLHLIQDTSPVMYEGAERYLQSFRLENDCVGAVASTRADFKTTFQSL